MKSEIMQALDNDDEEDSRFTTTKTRMIAALRRKTDNVEEIVRRIAEQYDLTHAEVKEIHGKVSKSASVLQSFANWLKFGGSEMDKQYPSKKK